ncbi:transposase domain-containing protein [Streptomyces caniscabiei]|uniref:transposase domain-containing protein n=1 Tax=Streptomyces caniscabiei TaxID=2746961 RepID=UPI003EB9C98F
MGALTRTFTPELVDFAIEEAVARERAVKSLPARLVVYFTLAMWLFTSVGYGGVLRELVEHWPLKRGEKWRPASTGSLTKARSRLGAGALRVLFDRMRGAQGTPATPGVFWRNLRLTSLDGTTFNVPDQCGELRRVLPAYDRGPAGALSTGAAAGPGRVRHPGRDRSGLRLPCGRRTHPGHTPVADDRAGHAAVGRPGLPLLRPVHRSRGPGR